MDDIKKLLGKRIRELRNTKGYSQQKLAEMINIDQRSLSYIECGKDFPSKCIFSIVKALGVEISELFEFSHLEINLTGMKEYIKKNVDNLTDENIKIIYRLIKSMK